MSELAFNIAGEPFNPGATTAYWRPMRMRAGKGPPEVPYGKDGLPAELPVDATMEDLRQAVDLPGRYRLAPLDAERKPVPNVPLAYVYVHADTTGPTTGGGALSMTQLVLEAMKGNREAMQLNREAMEVVCAQSSQVIDRFTQVMEQTSIMMGAAHGIGLTTLPPRGFAVDDADETDSDDEADLVEVEELAVEPLPFGIDWNGLVRKAGPFLKPLAPVAIAYIGANVPQLAPILKSLGLPLPADKKSAKPVVVDVTETPVPQEVSPAGPAPAASTEILQPTPAMLAHLIAIQAALGPDEVAIVKSAIRDMPEQDRNTWIRQLSALDVATAVAEIRKHLATGASAGGVS